MSSQYIFSDKTKINKPDVKIRESMQLLLRCQFRNASWFFNEEKINFHVEYVNKLKSSYLRIENVFAEMTGTYTCMGKDEFGNQIAAQSTVLVLSN